MTKGQNTRTHFRHNQAILFLFLVERFFFVFFLFLPHQYNLGVGLSFVRKNHILWTTPVQTFFLYVKRTSFFFHFTSILLSFKFQWLSDGT